ncbi:MAG: membrane dipeptidase [Cytophagaceae bacterium]|nr:membrane dipeptidase [Gemmatimonadaceae bacterium]
MRRRDFVTNTALSSLAIGLTSQGQAQGRPAAQRAMRPLIMDAMGELRPEYSADVVRGMLDSGIRSITVTLCDPKPTGAEGLQAAIDGLTEYDRLVASNPRAYMRATKIAHIDEARRTNRMAVFYLYQNTVQFGTDLDRVDLFYTLGLRSCQLTYNDRNAVGAGCRAEGPLTDFGRKVIDRMNRIGMLVDLSHANMPTMAGAIAASAKPVHISHTGCMAVHKNIRNTTDENLKALANKGGVVGICQIRPFLTTKKTDNLDAYVNHIDHAVKVAGIEHVCIGSDRDHRVITLTPEYVAELKREEGSQVVESELPLFLEALNGPRRMEVVWSALEKRGYKSADIERIMGTNLYRLYRDVIG